MLRIHTNASPSVAKGYFSSADYYSEGQELLGAWRGKGATRLGLGGEVRKAEWDRLCDNRHPVTGKPLTVRQKDGRRVGYDFTFDVPKSVSLLYGLTRDERLLDAFQASVDDAMEAIESEAQTRVRVRGTNEDRTTGNLVWGRYTHFTSRPVDGEPCPQLHAHCFVLNTTFDVEEERWKAVQLGGVKADAPFHQARFDAILGRRLADLGVPIERTATGWEIAGFDKPTLDKFSRRTAQIEAAAQRKGITDPRKKAALGATIREKKAKHLSMEELRAAWRSRLTPDEAGMIDRQAKGIGSDVIPDSPVAAIEAVEYASQHCFARSSVLPERRVLAEALKHAVGRASPHQVEHEFRQAGFLNAMRDGTRMVTTHEVLAEETRMLGFARNGRGRCTPLGGYGRHRFKRDWLNTEQRSAVQHVLSSPDRVMAVRGAAGVGKTSMLLEAVEALESSGHHVQVVAPSASASRGVLREKHIETADTVARLLVDTKMQERIRGGVLWVDEAGLLSSRDMAGVFDLANRVDARVILSGDRRQHGSVERGAALRLLEEEAGLMPAEMKQIQRQRADYKQAVQCFSEGRIEQGFRELDRLGWIEELPIAERYERLATDYVSAMMTGKTVLAISPTHAEGQRVNDAIRAALRNKGLLNPTERSVPTLTKVDMTDAQRGDAANYKTSDLVLAFHQNAKGFRRGERVSVESARSTLPLDQAERFQVFRRGELQLAPGDLVRITQNGQTADRKHGLHNGSVYKLKGFDRRGNLVLGNGWVVAKDFGFLSHGYVSTSHAAQGRDAQRVFVAQSHESFGASSQEQSYVSTSRGMEQVRYYTDSKQDLLASMKRNDERLSATELVAGFTPAPQRSMARASQHSPTQTHPRLGRWRRVPVIAALAAQKEPIRATNREANRDREVGHERQ